MWIQIWIALVPWRSVQFRNEDHVFIIREVFNVRNNIRMSELFEKINFKGDEVTVFFRRNPQLPSNFAASNELDSNL